MSTKHSVVLAIAALSCSVRAEPCMSPGVCGSGRECLANRCVELGAEPVPAGTQRIVLLPSALSVVSADEPDASGLPAAIRFGSRGRPALLYLRFAPIASANRQVVRAFLLLEPLPDSGASSSDVTVHAFATRGAWQPSALNWFNQPALSLPPATGIARSSPPSTLRIDVTAIVRHRTQARAQELGFALRSSARIGRGVAFATGVAGGQAPRLELYVDG